MGLQSYLLSASLIGVLAQRLVRVLCPECRQLTEPDAFEASFLGVEPGHQIYHAVGCEACHGSGFQGRTGIYELITVDNELRDTIHESSSEQLLKQAVRSKTGTIRDDGRRKVLAGITTGSGSTPRYSGRLTVTAFEYVALNENGSAKKGILEGDSSRHVRQLLRERGLTPVDVTVTRPNVQTGSWFQWWRRIPPMELALITRQIATMVGAGLAIEEAIQAVAQQSSSRKATSVLMTVRGNVMQGQSLSAALGEFPQTFTPMFRATVAAGEQSGYLDTVLENLADYLERSYETRRNVEMALYYPVILLVCAIAIVILVMTYVIPDIVEVFDTSGATLPAITSALIATSDVLRA